ncbi:MAG: hypothetical protein FJZ09_03970 [Candidatus Omnitrophica bacterium]|nr:hypothetical protein [Candidatus Omnitrophota bacterium]
MREKNPLRPLFSGLVILAAVILLCAESSAQEADLECMLDVAAKTVPLPAIFKPNTDLSGRGLHRDVTWPQEAAAPEALEAWQKEIGFPGTYRLKYNLWEIYQLSKNKNLQNKLLANYEKIIKSVSDSGGVVILDIFGTPAGLARVLDKRCPPADLRGFKQLIKGIIRDLSCNKKYNIWYEVWNAPDAADFFLGRLKDYLSLYRTVAEAVKELKYETKVYIPVGGPGASSWFGSPEKNTISTPENSLIYELIKFCYRNRLPLDFISWHGYSTDPREEAAATIYKKKSPLTLIREWLSYFRFDRNTPLLVDEWNFGSSGNILPERSEKSCIAASYIFSRLKNMYEAGLDNQIYFCLEDFQANKEGIEKNTGIFSFDSEYSGYKGTPKAAYAAFRMLAGLKGQMYPLSLNDDFMGVLATRSDDALAIIIYNYIDPGTFTSYIWRNIATLAASERKAVLKLADSGMIDKVKEGTQDIAGLRVSPRIKSFLFKAKELSLKASGHAVADRGLKINFKNLQGAYLYERFDLDSSYAARAKIEPIESKEIVASAALQESISLSPYSAQMIVLKKKPPEALEAAPSELLQVPAGAEQQ